MNIFKLISRQWGIAASQAKFERATKRGDTAAAERAREEAMSKIRAANRAFEGVCGFCRHDKRAHNGFGCAQMVVTYSETVPLDSRTSSPKTITRRNQCGCKEFVQ